MFNLFRSRDKLVRIVLTGLLVIVGLSMVTYLIPTTGNGYTTSSGDSTVVASIGKEDLTSQQVSKAIQNMTRSRQLPAELLSIYVPQIVQQMITERAIAYEAGQLGFKVTTDEADNAIMDTLPPQLVKDGKVDTATLNAMLQQQGVTMTDLRDDTARSLLVQRLRQVVGQGVIVTPAEIDAEFHKRNDKVKIEYASIVPAKYQAESEPTDAEVKAYYDSHKTSFQTPERRTVAVVLIDPAKVTAGVLPSDDQLKKDYNANLDKFRTQERVNLRHILIKSDATNDAAMKTKAEGILKQVQSGGDFAKLAKDNSQDPGSAAMGGELGWIVKGQTVPEFEKAAFSLQPGQTSGLIKTMYGYHILQVEQHEQAHLQPFDQVKGQLTADYMQKYTNDQMQKLADKAEAELRKDPLHPQKAADAVGGTVITADNVAAGDPIPGVGTSKEFSDALVGLKKGEVTAGPVVLTGNKVAVASVLDVKPAHPSSFEEAITDARSAARGEKLQKILTQKSTDLVAKANAMGGDLQKAAKELGLDVKTSTDVDRQGAFEGLGSASTVPDAFTKPVNSIFGPTSVAGGGLVVGKVIARTSADPLQLAAQTATLRNEIRQQKTQDRATLFEDGLKKRLQDEGKLKVHQDVITRLVQTYTTKS
jgi:peptidyl-prolyl cis-trans isomerase D